MFAESELQMGKMAESGEALTADALSAKYLALNKLYFGDTMISDDEIALEWTRIPHFYYNYYVFQYATSFSAAVAIANRILREGESAVRDYKKFLSGGCSKEPVELLRDMGVDMRTSAPVNDALSLFGELIDELSALLADTFKSVVTTDLSRFCVALRFGCPLKRAIRLCTVAALRLARPCRRANRAASSNPLAVSATGGASLVSTMRKVFSATHRLRRKTIKNICACGHLGNR